MERCLDAGKNRSDLSDFVVLSTIVASLGPVQDNVAVVVGAIVIAPL